MLRRPLEWTPLSQREAEAALERLRQRKVIRPAHEPTPSDTPLPPPTLEQEGTTPNNAEPTPPSQ
jgi:hypothetical protein